MAVSANLLVVVVCGVTQHPGPKLVPWNTIPDTQNRFIFENTTVLDNDDYYYD